MNNTSLFVVTLLLLCVFALWWCNSSKEGWYPTTTTYVNSPVQQGTYVTDIGSNNWGGNYYYALDWTPWGFHHYDWQYTQPGLGDVNTAYINFSIPADVSPNATAPVPLKTPMSLQSVYRPMLASYKSPKDYAIGQWVRAGTAYTDNPNDFSYLDVFQLNLDPGRDLFAYSVRTKDGQTIPLTLPPHHGRLEDGDRFKVQGMEGKGDFVFTEADKYSYVYV